MRPFALSSLFSPLRPRSGPGRYPPARGWGGVWAGRVVPPGSASEGAEEAGRASDLALVFGVGGVAAEVGGEEGAPEGLVPVTGVACVQCESDDVVLFEAVLG